jgi:VanZ family protein
LPRVGNRRWSIVWACIAFFMTALVASLDEWHQTFLPSRTGTIHDVFLDSAAALAAQILLFFCYRGWKEGEPRKPEDNSSLARTSELIS